ncbi:MAG: hypothetical protein JNN11_04360 [Candidatus Doudnabacteria bacterium]|nr:hypothetical protein [Candidatus Doudnabacteria bacterium]
MENKQTKITNVAILLLNFNLPEMTDKLAEQIERNIKFPHKLFLLDNGSEVSKRAKHATHILEKNIGMNGGVQYLWDLVKDDKSFDGYWFLCNDIILDEGRDYLNEMSVLFEKLSQKYNVGSVTTSYHFEGKEQAVPVFMKKRVGGTFRPIVWIEWNAILYSREFMQKFFPQGFGLKTKHAFQDVVSNYVGWKNGYGSFVMDSLPILHLENQTFLKHGGKMINGVFVPDYKGLENMLVSDMDVVVKDFNSKGIDLLTERKHLHKDIDQKGNFEKYLVNGPYKQSLFEKLLIKLKI